jgi:hypothetical protein
MTVRSLAAMNGKQIQNETLAVGSKMIAGNCRGLISLSRLKGPANHSFEGFLLSLFPLRSINRVREGQ